MKQMKERDQWISEIMNSTEGIQRPDANPFLYEKIKYRMQHGKAVNHLPGKVSLAGWVAAIIILLAVNGLSIAGKIRREKHVLHREAYNSLGAEMMTQTIYNY